MNRRQRLLFTSYWQERLRQAGAITPGQKLALLAEIERELRGEDEGMPGYVRVPREGGGSVRLPLAHPLVAAALEGRPVAVGGQTVVVAAASPGQQLQALSSVQKLAAIAAVMLLPLCLIGALILRPSAAATAVVSSSTPTVSTTATSTPTATGTPEPTPTASPPVVMATATPYSVALISGQAAPSGNDPASIELEGFSYILSTGQVLNGAWTPSGAEWLAGTTLRRVVAVPWEPELATSVAALRPGAVLRLRLRSGEVVKYRVREVSRRPRQQIEVLADRQPSLAVILHGEATADRWVVIADAIQEPQPLTGYTAAAAPEEEAPPLPTLPATAPTATVTLPTASTVITGSQVVTDTDAGLALAVAGCERAQRIGEALPPNNRQGFLVCDVTLTALDGATGTVPYSGEALAVTELAWISSNVDWWPSAVPVSQAVRSGTLTPGRSTSGRVAGVVQRATSNPLNGSRSEPVLVWEQAGRRWLIRLDLAP